MSEKIGELEVGGVCTDWFFRDESYTFQPSAGPVAEFGSDSFVIACDAIKMVLFDGRTFEYNLEKRRSSCTFCGDRKKIDVECEDLVQIAQLEMPYGYTEYSQVFEYWKNEGCYDPRDGWDSICPSCLRDVREFYCEVGKSENIASRIL